MTGEGDVPDPELPSGRVPDKRYLFLVVPRMRWDKKGLVLKDMAPGENRR